MNKNIEALSCRLDYLAGNMITVTRDITSLKNEREELLELLKESDTPPIVREKEIGYRSYIPTYVYELLYINKHHGVGKIFICEIRELGLVGMLITKVTRIKPYQYKIELFKAIYGEIDKVVKTFLFNAKDETLKEVVYIEKDENTETKENNNE